MLKSAMTHDLRAAVDRALETILPNLPPGYYGEVGLESRAKTLVICVGQGAIFTALKLKSPELLAELNKTFGGTIKKIEIKFRH